MQGLYQGLFRLRFSVAVFAAAAILAGLSVVTVTVLILWLDEVLHNA